MLCLSTWSAVSPLLSIRESNGLLSKYQNGEGSTDVSVGGGHRADSPHQPDVLHVPSLHEEKLRVPDSAPQHPLRSPGSSVPG